MMDYNIPGGKLNRGLTVVHTCVNRVNRPESKSSTDKSNKEEDILCKAPHSSQNITFSSLFFSFFPTDSRPFWALQSRTRLPTRRQFWVGLLNGCVTIYFICWLFFQVVYNFIRWLFRQVGRCTLPNPLPPPPPPFHSSKLTF